MSESEKVLVLRVCHADMSSSHGFVWPASGPVGAPDWNPVAECGQGLHGWLYGEGSVSGSGAEWAFSEQDCRWLVIEVLRSDIVPLDGKIKFPRGNVVFCGDLKSATDLIALSAPGNVVIIGRTATAGNRGTATAGYAGTATAGNRGTATAGYAGTATAGNYGTATAGDSGTILLKRWDTVLLRYRWVTGEVGIDGIEANVPYCMNEEGKLVKK